MESHIIDLFEKAQPFSDSDLTFHPGLAPCSTAADTLENMLMECFGSEVARLMSEYAATQLEVERFQCLHFFRQGYLAAQAEQKKVLTQKRQDFSISLSE